MCPGCKSNVGAVWRGLLPQESLLGSQAEWVCGASLFFPAGAATERGSTDCLGLASCSSLGTWPLNGCRQQPAECEVPSPRPLPEPAVAKAPAGFTYPPVPAPQRWSDCSCFLSLGTNFSCYGTSPHYPLPWPKWQAKHCRGPSHSSALLIFFSPPPPARL